MGKKKRWVFTIKDVVQFPSMMFFFSGARGEADAQNITVLAMWMIEHPGNEDDEEPQSEVTVDSRHGTIVSGSGGKSGDHCYLQSPGDIPSADATEMEEGFSER